LDRQSSANLSRIVSTAAAQKAISGATDSITFNDACGFWDITVRSNANTLNARLSEVSALLGRSFEAAQGKVGAEGAGLKLGNVMLSGVQISELIQLHQSMQERFKTELDFIRKRVDERAEKRARPF
jgi:hypothetical protein